MPAGGLYGRIPKIFRTAEECRKACIDMPGCAGFVFVKSEKKTRDNCAVKSKWDSSTKLPEQNCCDSGRVTEACRKTGITSL